MGHSLGGGIAALIAYCLVNDSVLRYRLGQAVRVNATTFGAPPVMTAELSWACEDFVTSVVLAVSGQWKVPSDIWFRAPFRHTFRWCC